MKEELKKPIVVPQMGEQVEPPVGGAMAQGGSEARYDIFGRIVRENKSGIRINSGDGGVVTEVLKDLPKMVQIDQDDIQKLPTNSSAVGMSDLPKEWDLPMPAIKTRLAEGHLDMRYSMLTLRKGKIMDNQEFGRKWTSKYRMNVNFPSGNQFYDEPVVL